MPEDLGLMKMSLMPTLCSACAMAHRKMKFGLGAATAWPKYHSDKAILASSCKKLARAKALALNQAWEVLGR